MDKLTRRAGDAGILPDFGALFQQVSPKNNSFPPKGNVPLHSVFSMWTCFMSRFSALVRAEGELALEIVITKKDQSHSEGRDHCSQ